MNKEIVSKSKIIALHSEDGEKMNKYFNSSILFNFTDVIKRHENTLYLTISIQSAEIPYSFYNVSINYNTIYYAILGIYYTMTIPEGNYTATTFITEFNNQFSLGSHNKTATLSISKSTGKFSLTAQDSTFDITIYKNETTSSRILGLNQDTTFTSAGETFDFPANLLGTQKIKIFSKALACDNISSYHLGSNDMIDQISVNASPFELINYSNTTTLESHMKNTDIQQIDIQLKDEYNSLIDFNGINWSLGLIITEYCLGETIIPVGNFDSILFQKREKVLKEIKKNKNSIKIEVPKNIDDNNEFYDKTLDFLTDLR